MITIFLKVDKNKAKIGLKEERRKLVSRILINQRYFNRLKMSEE